MIVRRFLGCIAVITVLVVAAGFAFFEFGDRALTAAATPVGHFAPPPPASGPDYALDSSWLAKPGQTPLTDWRPTGTTAEASEKRRLCPLRHHAHRSLCGSACAAAPAVAAACGRVK